MRKIIDIDPRSLKAKPVDVEDPMAHKVEWSPANRGGSNFKSQKMTVTDDRVVVGKTGITFMIWSFFAASGLIIIPYACYLISIDGARSFGLKLLIFGFLFAGTGLPNILVNENLTIDKKRGVYFTGRVFDQIRQTDRFQQGYLWDIHAIQVIRKFIRSSSGSIFYSYEVNLVMKDGLRVNIMDCGAKKHTMLSAQKLSTFLSVPIWKAD